MTQVAGNTSTKLTPAQLQAKVLELEQKLVAEQQKNEIKRTIKFKVSEKGGVSVYGLNARFPVTLYGDQWERLIAKTDDLKAFIETNRGSLKTKQ
jgi:hypothetical protein